MPVSGPRRAGALGPVLKRPRNSHPRHPPAFACHPPQHASEKEPAARPDAQEAEGEVALPAANSGLAGADAPAQPAALVAAAAFAGSQHPLAAQQHQDVQQNQEEGSWPADVLQQSTEASPPLEDGLQKKKRTRWLEYPPASLQFAMLLSENSVKLKSFHVPGGC